MKKLLVTLAAMLVSISAFAQGTVAVGNRNLSSGTPNVPIYLSDGATGPGAQGGQAQLYLVSGSGAAATYTAVAPVINFRTTSAAGYPYLEGPTTVTIPGVNAGQPADVVLRAWVGGASYEAAKASANGQFGQSDVLHLAQLGGDPGTGAPPITPPDLSGLNSFTLTTTPEPSTIALAVLGASALFIRRRK